MKKRYFALILIIGLLATHCGAFSAYAQEGSAVAQADTASHELFLPETYEQYLELDAPTDFAINDEYIAIADGSTIYLCNYTAPNPQYMIYTHQDATSISTLEFYETEQGTYLFFGIRQDTQTPLVYIDCNAEDFFAQEAISTGIQACISFCIIDDILYYSNQSGSTYKIYSATMNGTTIDMASVQEIMTPTINGVRPFLTEYNGEVYYSYSNHVVGLNGTQWQLEHAVSSFSVLGTVCYYASTNTPSSFFKANLSGSETEILQQDETQIPSVKAIRCYQNLLYLVHENFVREFSPADDTFTGYEIGKYSDGFNRIGNATDISFFGDKILISDTENRRILFYDTIQNTYFSFLLDYEPENVCAGKDVFSVCNGSDFYIYSYSDNSGEAIYHVRFSNTVIDCAYSFGSFYLLTAETNGKHIIEPTADGRYSDVQVTSTSTSNSFSSITTDFLGNIYLLSGKYVYRFTRDTFLQNGLPVASHIFPVVPNAIASDYAGKLYGLTDSAIYCSDGTSVFCADLSTLKSIVYPQSQRSILAFAIGFESSYVYLLSDGFIVKLGLGTNAPRSLKNISSDGLYEAINGDTEESAARGMLVTVPAGSVLLSLDAENLAENAQTVSYSDYSPLGEARVGILVCELPDGGGSVVAFFEYDPEYTFEADGSQFTATLRNYTLALVLGDESELTVLSEAYDDTGYVGYTTNEVGLYRFPAMSLLTERNNPDNPLETEEKVSVSERLTKNEAVTALFTLRCAADDSQRFGLDADYCFVRTERGTYGFVPANYVLSYDPSSTVSANFEFRNLRKGASVTLYASDGQPLTLSSREQLKVYGEADENGMIYAEYTDESGVVYSGYIEESSLYSASGSVVAVLVAVTLVTAAVLCSVCYLIFRKQPTLQ